MGFGSYLGNGFKALALKKEAVAAIRDDPASAKYSSSLTLLLFAITLAIFVVSSRSATGYGSLLVFFIPLAVFTQVLVLLVVHGFARLFGGIASFKQFYAVALSVIVVEVIQALLSLLLPIPFGHRTVTFIIDLYALCLLVFFVYDVHALRLWKSVAVVLLAEILVVAISTVAILH
jgi:hypothetical protein